MNNPIDVALTRIRATIPPEILNYTFQQRDLYQEVFPIDQMILDKVIRPRCIKDINVFGGRQKKIVLRREYMEPLERNKDDFYLHTGGFSLFRIPPEEREGLPISDVTNIQYYGPYSNYLPGAAYNAGASFNSLANAVLDSHTFRQSPPTPRVEVLSGDLIKLTPSQWTNVRWILNCRLCYDDNLTNLNTSAIVPFADLCVYAVQAYIYNQLAITIDKAFIQAGYQLGTFKSIVDGYNDANQKYNDQLDQVAGAMMLAPDRLEAILPYIV